MDNYGKDMTLSLIKYILTHKNIPKGGNGTIYRKLFTAYSLVYENPIFEI